MHKNNKPYLKKARKQLRSNGTSAEATLWLHLKNKQLDGRRFRRQFSIDNCILDFYCPSEKLAVELDGAHHYTPAGMASDINRDGFLNDMGVVVLRFENKLVFENIDYVLSEIKRHFLSHSVLKKND